MASMEPLVRIDRKTRPNVLEVVVREVAHEWIGESRKGQVWIGVKVDDSRVCDEQDMDCRSGFICG